MDGYELLRARAAAKMDEAIQAARREFRSTLAKIDALRRELGDEPEEDRSIRVQETALDAVRRYMPRDRPFSVAEIITILRDSVPEVHRTRSGVKSALYRLGFSGELQRIARDAKGHILWACTDSGVTAKPYSTMPMSDVIADVLEGTPLLRPAEIAIAMQQLGFRTEQDRVGLVRNVRKSLSNNPRRFQHDGEQRWSLT